MHRRRRKEILVEKNAIRILDRHRTMAISTVRPDGWPQTTIVGYANDGLTLYFLIFRSGQKFANIDGDDRVSIAVGGEARDLSEVEAVYAGAHATEITDASRREAAWQLLVERHPNLGRFVLPVSSEVAMMTADCRYVSVVELGGGLESAEAFTIPADNPSEDQGS